MNPRSILRKTLMFISFIISFSKQEHFFPSYFLVENVCKLRMNFESWINLKKLDLSSTIWIIDKFPKVNSKQCLPETREANV